MKKVLKNLMFALTFLAFGLSSCSMDSDSPDSSSAVEKPQPQKPDPKPAPEPEPQIDTELIAAQDALKSLVERALNFADKAREGDELGQYLEGAKAELTVSIAAAQKLLDSEDKVALKAGRLTLAKALSDFFKLKKTPTWTVIFEKGNDGDQSRVKIIWEDDGDSLDLSAVTGYESFVIDGTPAHIYWPDNANQLDSENKSVQWGPAFAPENFAPGSHTLTFRLIRGSGEESQKWDFTFEYDLEKTAETDDVIEPLFVDMDLYQPTVADLLPGLEPLITGAKEMLEKAEEGDGYGQYETGAVSAFEAAVSQAEAARNASKPEEVEDAIAAIKEAAKIFASKKNVPGWTFLFSRLEGNDQTKIEITWENEEDALTEDAIKKENESFVLDGKVSSGFWAADGKTSGVEDKTLFYKPLFNDFFNPGEHTFEFIVIQPPKDGEKHQKEWKVTLKYNPALTVGQNTAFDLTYTDISFVKHDWAAEAKKDLQDAIARAEEFAEKAEATGDEDNIYYEASDIDTFRTAISAANGVKENPLATEEEVEAAIEALSEAKESLMAAKKIRMWNVEFLRRTNDQTTVKISWQKDEYKLEDAENAVVDENGNPSVKSFRIDEVVAGQYWAGASMGNTTNENFITLVPTFAAPALNNGSHTLCFTLAKGEDEYEIEVPFTLNGKTNTDECEAEIGEVKVSRVDPEEKARKQLQKEKDAFQKQIDEVQLLVNNADASKYEDGAIDALSSAIVEANDSLAAAKTKEAVEEGKTALKKALSEFQAKKKIDMWEVSVEWLRTSQAVIEITWAKDDYKLTLDNIQDSAHPTVQSVLDANQSGHGGADGIINEINGLTLKYGINIWYWDQHLGGDDTFIIYLKNVDGKNYKLSQKFHMENGSTAEGQNRYIADSDWEISEDE